MTKKNRWHVDILHRRIQRACRGLHRQIAFLLAVELFAQSQIPTITGAVGCNI